MAYLKKTLDKMKLIVSAVLICSVLMGIAFAIGWYVEKEEKRKKEIVNEVKELIGNCRTAGTDIPIVGKVLVWDMRMDAEHSVHHKLPNSLLADSKSSPITVFMKVDDRKELVGTYSISGQQAFRQYADFAVVLWPDKKPVGYYSVASREPPSSRAVQYHDEYGNPDEQIAKWIMTLQQVAH